MYEPHLAVHDARRQTLLSEAARARLTALATCCRPSALRSGARRLLVRVGELARPRRAAGACCA